MSANERLLLALTELAARDKATPCQGRRSARWTSDSHDDLEWASWHCSSMSCPVLEECGAAADEDHIKHFVWGGRIRSPKPRSAA
ncbi:hypothetical protein BJ986_000210 [Phycicoccus badiiscoriae]|uniref:4Fe-4S Wbl-type domain-containing protein n=1 Tax=Pedococcus badiiscoriae TaxID=642776 RepID=A0A852W9L9_9MICO|nr:hypothetical protein [Pedococcus badiiscoriae]NYG05723.1 hypothetical protein [Pedococcus badiiscoriae]